MKYHSIIFFFKIFKKILTYSTWTFSPNRDPTWTNWTAVGVARRRRTGPPNAVVHLDAAGRHIPISTLRKNWEALCEEWGNTAIMHVDTDGKHTVMPYDESKDAELISARAARRKATKKRGEKIIYFSLDPDKVYPDGYRGQCQPFVKYHPDTWVQGHYDSLDLQGECCSERSHNEIYEENLSVHSDDLPRPDPDYRADPAAVEEALLRQQLRVGSLTHPYRRPQHSLGNLSELFVVPDK